MEQPAGLEEWGPDRQSWKGDGAGGGAAAAAAAPGGSFPMSEGTRSALEALTAEGAGVAGWLGSPQSRELACHALEQYTSRPWRKSPLLEKARDGMQQGEVPSLSSLR